MDILKALDQLLYTSEINYESLPDKVIERLSELLLSVEKQDVLSGLQQLKPVYDEKITFLRSLRGGSGHADQELMVEEMKKMYLEKSIVYVENR